MQFSDSDLTPIPSSNHSRVDALVARLHSEMYGSFDSSDILFPTSGSQLLSQSPPPSSTSSRTDDLSLSELSLTDRIPAEQKVFSLLAPTKDSLVTRPDSSVDGDALESDVREETKEHDKRHAAKLYEDKLQSDIFILKKLNASFALFNEALQDTGSANQVYLLSLYICAFLTYVCLYSALQFNWNIRMLF